MITLTISEVCSFKDEMLKNNKTKIHFHDGCGGQYFTIEENNEELKKGIDEYFKKKKLLTKWSDDNTSFTLEK